MSNKDLLFMPELLDDFEDFSKNHKAKIVYRKCLKSGKFNLARKIANKYALNLGKSDITIAFGMALANYEK